MSEKTRHWPVPGTVAEAGRRFLYLEQSYRAKFSKTFRAIGDHIEQTTVRYPDGGMITENTRVTLPDGRVFYGLSFKGDVDEWERGVKRFASEHQLRVAVVEHGEIKVEDETSYPLGECAIEFLESP